MQYGSGMATHSEDDPGNEFFLHVDPTVDNEDSQEFELSNCKVSTYFIEKEKVIEMMVI